MRAAIIRSHEIRNDAQHNGRIPSPEEVEDCRRNAKDFLDHVVTQVWDISLQDISVADLIQDERCREYMSRAEAALAAGDFPAAIGNAGAGLKVAQRIVERRIYPFEYDGVHYPAGILVSDNMGVHRPLFDLVLDNNARHSIGSSQAVWHQFEQMKTAVIFASINLNFFEYLNFGKITGEITLRGRDEYEARNSKEHPTVHDAEFAVSYAVSTAIHFEGALTD